MNPEIKIETHVMDKKRLEGLMLKDQPIVPPDSVIKTWPHLRGENVDLVLTQDKDGLAQGSFIVKRGDWGKFFLDTWFDPLYRSYNFQKAETHALVSCSIFHDMLPILISKTGTHRPMAPNDPVKTRHYPATNHQCLRTRSLYRGRWKI
jgi:mannan polymerase II complex MNN11 subunit